MLFKSFTTPAGTVPISTGDEFLQRTHSALPPPISIIKDKAAFGASNKTPFAVSSASSCPEITSIFIPVSDRTLFMNSPEFLASLNALVPTALMRVTLYSEIRRANSF